MTTNVPEKKNAPQLSAAPAEPEVSVGQLVSSAMGDVTSLVRREIDLAKAELTFSVKNGGLALGLFIAAGFLLLLSVIMVSIAFAFLIHLTGLKLAWCFLIITGAYLVLAGILAFIGVKRVKFVGPPKRAIEQAVETKNALTSRG